MSASKITDNWDVEQSYREKKKKKDWIAPIFYSAKENET